MFAYNRNSDEEKELKSVLLKLCRALCSILTMTQHLFSMMCLLLIASSACRKSSSTDAPPPNASPTTDPARAQKVAQSFGHLKNARLVALGKAEESMQGHVEWALWTGETNAYMQCRRELIFCELALAELSRERAAIVFGHVKNARLALMGKPAEPMRGHIQWAKNVSDDEFKSAVRKQIRDFDSALIQMFGE